MSLTLGAQAIADYLMDLREGRIPPADEILLEPWFGPIEEDGGVQIDGFVNLEDIAARVLATVKPPHATGQEPQ